MAFNGSGVYSAPSNSFNPAVSSTDISPTDWAALLSDLSTAMSTAICKDGQQVTTAVIPFASGITLSGGANLTTYITGTWTPTDASGAGLSFAGSTGGNYIKIGKMVLVWGIVVFPATASAVQAIIGSLPFTAANTTNGFPSINIFGATTASVGFVNQNSTTFGLAGVATGASINNSVYSGVTLYFSGVYPTTS